MNALILIQSQTDALLAANQTRADKTRIIEPVEIGDGQFMLNADVLDDPTFSNPENPWKQILDQIPKPKPTDATLESLSILAEARTEARVQQKTVAAEGTRL